MERPPVPGALALVLLFLGAPAFGEEPALAGFATRLDAVVREASPHLVQVIREVGGEATESARTRMIGTGVTFRPGYVLTSTAVVGPASDVRVVYEAGDTLDAHVVGVDRRSSVAVLEVAGLRAGPFPIARDAILFPGDMVVLLGLGPPRGPRASFGTAVLVEGPSLGFTEVEMLQLTAPAYPGATGGALVNTRGELVGLVSGRMTLDPETAILPEGTSLVSGYFHDGQITTTDGSQASVAVPIGAALEIAQELIERGEVRRGYLGVQVELVQIGSQRSAPFPGVMIYRLVPDGPAATAGFVPGDVILKYAHAPVTSPEDLSFLVAATRPGSDILVLYLRRGARSLATVHIGQAPEIPWGPDMDVLSGSRGEEASLAPLGR